MLLLRCVSTTICFSVFVIIFWTADIFSWPSKSKTCLSFWNTCPEYSFKSSSNHIVIYFIIYIRQAYATISDLASLFLYSNNKWNSEVGILTRLWAARPINCGLIPGRSERYIFPPNRRDCLWGATQAPIQWASGVLCPNEAWAGYESDHSLPSSAEVKCECSYAFGLCQHDVSLM